MRHFLTVPVLLLASALWGCAALSDPAERLQTTLRTHSDPTFNELFVTESTGVLRIGGFVYSLKQKNAVEKLVNNHALINEVGFAGRIESRVVLYADYDCRASNECVDKDKCSTDAQCFAEYGCLTKDECW